MRFNLTNNGKDVLVRIENETGSLTLLEKDIDQLVSVGLKNKITEERRKMLTVRKKELELQLAQIEKELR